MPMNVGQILARCQQVLDDSATARAAIEAGTTLVSAMAFGNQWSAAGIGRTGGYAVNTLRTIIRPESSVIRVAMNQIRERYDSITSRFLTPDLQYTVDPMTGQIDHQLSARVGDRGLRSVTAKADNLRSVRVAERWATLCGSGFVYRALQPVGAGIRWLGDDGKARRNDRGEEAIIREREVQWRTAASYELCRDPSANTVTFEGEDCVGIERPMSLAWLHQQFPETLGIKTDMTMGQMLQVQNDLNRIIRGEAGAGAFDSKVPGICFSVWWLRDATADPEDGNPWPWMALCYRDTGDASDRNLRVLRIRPNPNWGLGVHQIVFKTRPGSAWGEGMVRGLIDVQNALNLVFSDMLRCVLLHTGNRLIVEDGSLLDDESKVLSKDLSVIIRIRPGFKPPTRLEPPALDANVASIMANAPTWFDALSGSAAIYRGESGKRETSGRLAALKIEQADAPLDAAARDVELVINELLMGTLADIQHTAGSTERLLKRLGPDFTYEQVATFLDQPIMDAVQGVRVAKDSLRPQTASEVRQDTFLAVNQGIIDAFNGRMAILVKSGEAVDPAERDAFFKQQQEIQLMRSGKRVRVGPGQRHDVHMWVLNTFMDSPQWDHLSDAEQEVFEDHWQEHWDMKQARAWAESGRSVPPSQQPAQQQSGMAPQSGGVPVNPNETETAFTEQGGIPNQPGMGAQAPMPGAPGAAPASFVGA